MRDGEAMGADSRDVGLMLRLAAAGLAATDLAAAGSVHVAPIAGTARFATGLLGGVEAGASGLPYAALNICVSSDGESGVRFPVRSMVCCTGDGLESADQLRGSRPGDTSSTCREGASPSSTSSSSTGSPSLSSPPSSSEVEAIAACSGLEFCMALPPPSSLPPLLLLLLLRLALLSSSLLNAVGSNLPRSICSTDCGGGGLSTPTALKPTCVAAGGASGSGSGSGSGWAGGAGFLFFFLPGGTSGAFMRESGDICCRSSSSDICAPRTLVRRTAGAAAVGLGGETNRSRRLP